MADGFDIKINDIKLNIKGVREVLTSDGVRAKLLNMAQKSANAANSMAGGDKHGVGLLPYKGYSLGGSKYALGRVTTHSNWGEIDNARNNTLAKSLHAGS